MDKKLRMPDIEDLARKWKALAERRREHFNDLYNSGRWRRYYRQHSFMAQMNETARMADAWTKVAYSARLSPA